MARVVGIGIQDFESIIRDNCFYVDKTDFIREWWESRDSVTLLTRPRRFGKTLNISMLECFFSNKYKNRGGLFEGLSIWREEEYRRLQGTYPVISLSFAGVKENNYLMTKKRICQILTDVYNSYAFLMKSDLYSDEERRYFYSVNDNMEDIVAVAAIQRLSGYLCRYYGKKVIILLDEYDTPMQEAYVNGYWNELAAFTRSMFNSAFKTNPCMERAVLTGITRMSKESVFSDLNNLEVVTTTSDKYAAAFGFTEEEMFAALEECGLSGEKERVKWWYDGFTFGNRTDIYNPWSALNFLGTGKYNTYWANTSANSLVGKLLREGNPKIKEQFEALMQDAVIESEIDEQIVFSQLDDNPEAVWSLLLASGYLKVVRADTGESVYQLALTNNEVKRMFRNMVHDWFAKDRANYNEFIRALLLGDKKAMNTYMNRVALSTFSYFDTGKHPSGAEPERFYHGFVLGLLVELRGRYAVTSNRESGFGRYDVMLEPLKETDDAVILEFKVHDPEAEDSLRDTVNAALAQIETKKYARMLMDKGIAEERIRKYGFAFEGRVVLIG